MRHFLWSLLAFMSATSAFAAHSGTPRDITIEPGNVPVTTVSLEQIERYYANTPTGSANGILGHWGQVAELNADKLTAVIVHGKSGPRLTIQDIGAADVGPDGIMVEGMSCRHDAQRDQLLCRQPDGSDSSGYKIYSRIRDA